MGKSWIIWTVVIPLVATGSVFAGVMLGSREKQPESTGDQSLTENAKSQAAPQTDSAQLIIGKWNYSGNSDSVSETVSQLFRHTVEYFEDGTYQEKYEGDPPATYPRTTNGDYVVLSDGRLKLTYEYCGSSPCKEVVNTSPVSFPDPNTLWRHYEFGGKVGGKEKDPQQ